MIATQALSLVYIAYIVKKSREVQPNNFVIPQVIIGTVSEFTKEDSLSLRSFPDALKLLSKLIDYRIAYYAENFRRIESTDNDLRIYQGYINALIALR